MTPIRVLILMGVSGAGKTTVGRALADRLGWAFEDADAYHSAEALAAMARGQGLTDADRAPWLERLQGVIRQRVAEGPKTVLACSALKAAYRTALGAELGAVRVIWLDAPPDLLAERLRQREGHTVGPSLLPSQLDTLEPPSQALRLDASRPVHELVDAGVEMLG
ncbi:MAG: gluconokinase [Rubricoccaceae bacterium]